MRTRIKFCGCVDAHDVTLAVETGADAIGMIFADSPRRITVGGAREIARILPPFITPVAVFVNPAIDDLARVRELFPDVVLQLHGSESPAFVASIDGKVVKVLHVPPGVEDTRALELAAAQHPRAMLMFDTSASGRSGGTGVPFQWRAVAPIAHERQIIVGGGLTPGNVSNCVRTIRPFGVDVRSGIETDGKKDIVKMRAFVQAVKETDAA